ncbi:MAG: glycosyltransferase family 2 protein [Planctomycetaceae bacterium]|nr:glycosyltransferase family 2 protein [Planctomycetaceae bacterium]
MSRFTIIIPLLSNTPTEAFEETLASVLVHKPENTEVLIANATQYSDPWNTAAEGAVFIASDHLSNPMDVLNKAVLQSQGDILHILYPGTEVSTQWTQNILPLFEESKLGIVIPCVYDRRKPKRIFSLGIYYKPEGVLRTIRRSQWAEAAQKRIVPHISAMFIRKKALMQIGLFDTGFIPQISYVDAAMGILKQGWGIAVDQECRITVRPNYLPATNAFIWGVQIERLYFRWFGQNSTFTALGKHFGSFGIDFWRHLPKFKAFQILFGRLFGLFFFGEMLTFFQRPRKTIHQFTMTEPSPTPIPVEFDPPDHENLSQIKKAA